jgi:hypothetical protein
MWMWSLCLTFQRLCLRGCYVRCSLRGLDWPIGRVNCCWASPALSFFVPSPTGLMTIVVYSFTTPGFLTAARWSRLGNTTATYIYIYTYNEWIRHLSYQLLMVKTETISETSDANSTLTPMTSREDFILYCRRESFTLDHRWLLEANIFSLFYETLRSMAILK